MFSFAESRARRRPGLTPLIDVVFLLLVFFMLASQFGRDVALPLNTARVGISDYSGPPRLVAITPGAVLLNGIETPLADLGDALGELTEKPSDPIILQPREGADVQRLTDVVTTLASAGYIGLILSGGAP